VLKLALNRWRMKAAWYRATFADRVPLLTTPQHA
jgi:hypothetical protein